MKKNIFIILGLVVLVLIVQRVPVELGRGLASSNDCSALPSTWYPGQMPPAGMTSTQAMQCWNDAVTGASRTRVAPISANLAGNGLTAPTSNPVNLCASGAQPNSCGVKKNPGDTGYSEYLTCIHQHLCWAAGVTNFRGDYKGYTKTKNGGYCREPYSSDPTAPTMDQYRKCLASGGGEASTPVNNPFITKPGVVPPSSSTASAITISGRVTDGNGVAISGVVLYENNVLIGDSVDDKDSSDNNAQLGRVFEGMDVPQTFYWKQTQTVTVYGKNLDRSTTLDLTEYGLYNWSSYSPTKIVFTVDGSKNIWDINEAKLPGAGAYGITVNVGDKSGVLTDGNTIVNLYFPPAAGNIICQRSGLFNDSPPGGNPNNGWYYYQDSQGSAHNCSCNAESGLWPLQCEYTPTTSKAESVRGEDLSALSLRALFNFSRAANQFQISTGRCTLKIGETNASGQISFSNQFLDYLNQLSGGKATLNSSRTAISVTGLSSIPGGLTVRYEKAGRRLVSAINLASNAYNLSQATNIFQPTSVTVATVTPKINSISDVSVMVGDSVTIRGTGFSQIGNMVWFFGRTFGPFDSADGENIDFVPSADFGVQLEGGGLISATSKLRVINSGNKSSTLYSKLVTVYRDDLANGAPTISLISPLSINAGKTAKFTIKATEVDEITGVKSLASGLQVNSSTLRVTGDNTKKATFTVSATRNATAGFQALALETQASEWFGFVVEVKRPLGFSDLFNPLRAFIGGASF